MKMPKLPKSVALTLATPALISLVVPAASLLAQGQTDTKIRLMSDALRARDAGDLDTAKKNLEELLDIAPNDATVQRLLSGVNNSIASRPAASAPEVTAAAATPESAPAQAPAATAQKSIASEPTEVSYPPKPAAKAAPAKTPEQLAAAEADQITKQENQRINGLLADTKANRVQARKLAKDGRFDDAAAEIDKAIASLPVNSTTSSTIDDLHAEKSALLMEKAQAALKQGDTEGARVALEAYTASTSNTKKIDQLTSEINSAELHPPLQPIEKVSPDFVKDQKDIAKLSAKGRSQYLAGDLEGAQESFRAIESIDVGSPEAKSFLARIATEKAQVGELNRVKARAQMIEEVNNAWQRPNLYVDRANTESKTVVQGALAQKLNNIIIPSVNFQGVELGKVVSTLSEISEEFDKSEGVKGVNIVLIDPSNKNPLVTTTLRNLSLKRILDVIVEAAGGYQYELQADAIFVRPGGETSMLESGYFSVPKATVIKMTGLGSSAAPASAAADPFAAPAAAATTPGASGGSTESASIMSFLEQAGVKFGSIQGATLVYDGTGIIVNQTTRNLEKIRNILNRYNEVRQVEIEAKFLEVSQGNLDELGVNWSVAGSNRGIVTGNRSLGSAFNSSSTSSSGLIDKGDGTVPVTIPGGSITLPGSGSGPDLGGGQVGIAGGAGSLLSGGAPGYDTAGSATSGLAYLKTSVGEFSVSALIRAISRQKGTDLMSAPKVTVLSGAPASIVIAQEMRYPQSYGEIKSDTGGSSGGNSGGGGVTITAGTPQEFTTRNVGVELKVTPKVQDDDYSIDLELTPKVTEFDGFVEYGGTSVAISGSTTVTVPSGFYQPIFSTREVTTSVTVWDGATLVLGGLTREEVKKSNEKVPILGDIPLLGNLFRSKGESSSKRNLLIFVTPNLVTPGGSPKKQQLRYTKPASVFQNPTVVTPASAESRSRN